MNQKADLRISRDLNAIPETVIKMAKDVQDYPNVEWSLVESQGAFYIGYKATK